MNKQLNFTNKVYTLYIAIRDPDVPWYIKLLVGLIIAYIISPLDIIPDFIPVLGLLDEVILVPLAINLAIRLMPEEIMQNYQADHTGHFPGKMVMAGISVVLLIWFSVILIFYLLI